MAVSARYRSVSGCETNGKHGIGAGGVCSSRSDLVVAVTFARPSGADRHINWGTGNAQAVLAVGIPASFAVAVAVAVVVAMAVAMAVPTCVRDHAPLLSAVLARMPLAFGILIGDGAAILVPRNQVHEGNGHDQTIEHDDNV
eukprot:1091327-Rhodomonas_salina.2